MNHLTKRKPVKVFNKNAQKRIREAVKVYLPSRTAVLPNDNACFCLHQFITTELIGCYLNLTFPSRSAYPDPFLGKI